MKIRAAVLFLLSYSAFSYGFTIPSNAQLSHFRSPLLLRSCMSKLRPVSSKPIFRRTMMAAMPITQLADAAIIAAPSGVNLLPESIQASIFLSLFVALGLSTAAVTEIILPALKRSAPGFYEGWTKTFWLIGAGFILAGASHFLILQDFCNSAWLLSFAIFRTC